MGAPEAVTTSTEIGHWIAGQRDNGASGRTQAVFNPATGTVARQVHLAYPELWHTDRQTRPASAVRQRVPASYVEQQSS